MRLCAWLSSWAVMLVIASWVSRCPGSSKSGMNVGVLDRAIDRSRASVLVFPRVPSCSESVESSFWYL